MLLLWQAWLFFLSNAGVTQIPKILGPEVSVVAIKAMVMAIVGVMGRPVVKPCYECL